MASTVAMAALSTSSSLLLNPLSKPKLSTGSLVTGLPSLIKARVNCSVSEEKPVDKFSVKGGSTAAISASVLTVMSHPALALVDERLSTEGTGLGLGISNPFLIWILLGVFTLVWSLFFGYVSTLPKGDDDSGLAL